MWGSEQIWKSIRGSDNASSLHGRSQSFSWFSGPREHVFSLFSTSSTSVSDEVQILCTGNVQETYFLREPSSNLPV